MTGSVERVAKERPQLKKLIFVISWNLATGTRGGERKSQRQKYEDKIAFWRRSISGTADVEFKLVQESQLLDRLSQPEHTGRIWFWWDQITFGQGWLNRRYEEECAAASEKYRPDLQVDIPIQEDLLALGFDSTVLRHLRMLNLEIVSAAVDVRMWSRDSDQKLRDLQKEANDSVTMLKELAKTCVMTTDRIEQALIELSKACEVCIDALDAAEERLQSLEQDWRGLPDQERKTRESPQSVSSSSQRVLRMAIHEWQTWQGRLSGRLLSKRAYFLSGQAGSGKTHLMLDATKRALDDGRPAVFLSGARLGRSDLWGGVADQLGLPHVGADVLLGAMNAAGEAASLTGSRFIIFIDALNETTPHDYWSAHLPALRAKVAQYKNVALAVSCRDTYQDLVLNNSERPHYFQQVHPGFAEREIEAAQRYFTHYGLEAPKIPLLTPEFTLPLFLRMYCESLKGAAQNTSMSGHRGRIKIFEDYLRAKLQTIARRYKPAASSSYEIDASFREVKKILERLLDHLSQSGTEEILLAEAESESALALAATGGNAVRLLGPFQEEGVLVRDRQYTGNGDHEESLRIVFQAFSDFLLLKRRLALSADVLRDASIRSWLVHDASLGIMESATVLFPELFDVELPDFLLLPLSDSPADEDAPDTKHDQAWRIHRALVRSLPYRESSAVTKRTIDLLNATQPYMSREELYRLLFTLAPQQNNLLNADGLHDYLKKRKMPERDRDFGFATYHQLSDEFSPATRLARWAAAGPYPTYSPEVLELACIPLCWLFSSPNRYMRDWVTKALAQLLHGHLDVMKNLVERFWPVDDPYVVQRVVVVAYGALLRSSRTQTEEATALVKAVHSLVFTPPLRPDEVLLDFARGIVRWGVGQGLIDDGHLEALERPYGFRDLGSPPSKEALKMKYGGREDAPNEQTHRSLLYSVFNFGDFGRYVLEPAAHNFSTRRLMSDSPAQISRAPRLIRNRWKKFVGSLDTAQQSDLREYLDNPQPFDLSPLTLLTSGQQDPLTSEQRLLWDSAWVQPSYVADYYPADRVRRWVFKRTVSLGWTPDLFGKEDLHRGRGRGREGHKAERWGKKYQWMAYHEVLARLADNYQSSRRFDDDVSYQGLHQMAGEREIDPSLPPVAYQVFNEGSGNSAKDPTWAPPPITIPQWPVTSVNFEPYRSDIRRFLSDRESEPTISKSIMFQDSQGDYWIFLDGSIRQVDPLADKSWRGIQQTEVIDTFLVPAKEAVELVESVANMDRDAVRDITDWHGHTDCCFVGEVGRIAPACHHRHDALEQRKLKSKTFHTVSPVEHFIWEGGILDCSIDSSVEATLPSSYIQVEGDLDFDVRGPSWFDETGVAVFTNYRDADGPGHGFLVRASYLQSFLEEHNFELLVIHWFERIEIKEDYADDELHPRVEVHSVARIDKRLRVRSAEPKRTERDLH